MKQNKTKQKGKDWDHWIHNRKGIKTEREMNMNPWSLDKRMLFLGNTSSVTSSLCRIVYKRSYYIIRCHKLKEALKNECRHWTGWWEWKSKKREYSLFICLPIPSFLVHLLIHRFIHSLNIYLLRTYTDTISALLELLLSNKTQRHAILQVMLRTFKNCSLLWLKEKIHGAALGDNAIALGETQSETSRETQRAF